MLQSGQGADPAYTQGSHYRSHPLDLTCRVGSLGKNSDREGGPSPCFAAGSGEPGTSGDGLGCGPAESPGVRCPSHLHVEVGLAVEEVEEPLVVGELSVPLVGLVVAEVITQGHQQDVASEEPGLLAVLVQEQGCPAVGEGAACISAWRDPEQNPSERPSAESPPRSHSACGAHLLRRETLSQEPGVPWTVLTRRQLFLC